MKTYVLIFLLLLLFKLLVIDNQDFTCVIRNKTKIKGQKIYKYLNNSKPYFRIKKLYYKTLYKFDFVPRMEFNDKKLEIIEDFIKEKMTKKKQT